MYYSQDIHTVKIYIDKLQLYYQFFQSRSTSESASIFAFEWNTSILPVYLNET